MNFKPKNILVTGGAGFIGSHFIREILKALPDVKIINLDKLTYAGSMTNLESLPDPERHEFIHGDIRNLTLVSHIFQQFQIDTIVHFAAESHVDRSINSPYQFIETNVVGTFALLEAARIWFEEQKNPCRFHHISTDEVYGSLEPNAAAFNETMAYQPRSPYSASKASADHLVRAYYHTYNLPITISHCSNNYGPYQHAEKFIPTIINACLNKKPIPIYGKGKNIRDWIYVVDHCAGILKVLQQGQLGECYHIGGNNEWENATLALFICEQMQRLYPYEKKYKDLMQYVTDRAGHDFRYAMDASKIERELDWKQNEPMSSGIEKTIAFYCGSEEAVTPA